MGARGTVRSSFRRHFPAPPDVVFDWLQTPQNWLALAEVTSAAGSGRAGSHVEIVWANQKLNYEVVEYERPVRVVNVSGDVEEELLFAAVRGGTEVVVLLSVAHRPGLGRYEQWALCRATTAGSKQSIAAMAAALEARRTAAGDSLEPDDEPPVGPYFQEG